MTQPYFSNFVIHTPRKTLLLILGLLLGLLILVGLLFYFYSQLSKSTGITNKSQMIQLRKLQNVEAELSLQLSEKKGIMELRKK